MKKKIIALTVALVLVVAAAVSASLAYFTDSDKLDNSYSIGNVQIDAWEEVNHFDGAFVEDTSGDSVGNKFNGITTVIGENVDGGGYEYKGILPGDTMEKIVTVENKGTTDAYIAVAVKQKGWNEFNTLYVDNYYEKMTEEQRAFLLGDKYVANNLNATMQNITDAIFPGWGLIYDKYDDTYDFDVRYYTNKKTVDQDGSGDYRNTKDVQLLAIDYSVMKGQGANKSTGYKGNMFQTTVKDTGTLVYTSDPLYSAAADKPNDRIWVYYYYVPADKSVTLDLTVVCPTFFDAHSTKAFDGFKLDVRAAAIQADGFATAKAAFTELNRVYDFQF